MAKIPKSKMPSTADSVRLDTFMVEIAEEITDESSSQQSDGSFRIGAGRSLSISAQAGMWYDHSASVGGWNALSLIKHLGERNPGKWAAKFLSKRTGVGSVSADSGDNQTDICETSRAVIKHLVDTATALEGTAAETYLESRGITGPYPDNLGWVGEARIGEGAMLAKVMVDSAPVAIQVTYLSANGCKSNIKPGRQTYRAQADWQEAGVFTITTEDAPKRTVLVEGVEDALSLQQANAGSIITASLGLSNLGKAPVDTELPVVVFRDGDEPKSQADKSLVKGVDRLLLQGATVVVTDTPRGDDANSILQSCGSEFLLELIDAAVEQELSVDGEAIRCATLDEIEYEEIRKDVARRLGIRVSKLDGLVKKQQKHDDENELIDLLDLDDLEPWDFPVVLNDVLEKILNKVSDYLVADENALHTAVLWATHTHVVDHLDVSPRLAAQAPSAGCGKTIAMEVIANLVPRPLMASSITPSVVFRVIESSRPTLLLDEADQMFRDPNSDLMAILNSGHRMSTGYAIRNVETEEGYTPKKFSTGCASMFAGIGELPPTLQDRSIVMRLRRAKPGEVAHHIKNGMCDDLHDCGRKLARWSQDLPEWPEISLPKNLSNRIGDNWLPLITIAQIAGGEWPARVESAVEEALGVHEGGQLHDLLADIYEIYGEQEKMWTSAIVDKLIALDEKPYGECYLGKEISQNWLAKQLKGVTKGLSQDIRVGNDVKKGYPREAFFDAWERYGVGVGNVPNMPVSAEKDAESATKEPQTATNLETATHNPLKSNECSVVAAVAAVSTPLQEDVAEDDDGGTETW